MIESNLLSEAETWRMTDRHKGMKVEAVEIDAIRKSMRISRKKSTKSKEMYQRRTVINQFKAFIYYLLFLFYLPQKVTRQNLKYILGYNV